MTTKTKAPNGQKQATLEEMDLVTIQDLIIEQLKLQMQTNANLAALEAARDKKKQEQK